jgi:hypothetical protein
MLGYKVSLHQFSLSHAHAAHEFLFANSLAYAELYLTLAKIIPRFEMDLFETTVEDVEPERDFFVAVPKLDSKGVRVKVVGVN